MNAIILIALGGVELIALYILSRRSIQDIFRLLHSFVQSDKIVFSLIALLFFPGTIIHELSHLVVALLLFLRVRDIHIFPEWSGNQIRLGKVLYEKQDPVRGVIVGVAPIIIGIFALWWLSTLNLFYSEGIALKIVAVYIVFVISSTMFSSKQDLVDTIYLLPLVIGIGGILYVFNIDLPSIAHMTRLLEGSEGVLYAVNRYLFVAIGIHSIFITTIWIVSLLKTSIFNHK